MLSLAWTTRSGAARCPVKTPCKERTPVKSSMFLELFSQNLPLRSWRRAAGKARITLGAMPGRAPLILQSSLSSEGIDLRLLCAREKQQRV